MSKLEELLKELCPEGVKYDSFLDCCSYVRGITYQKSDESTTQTGTPVLRANNITLGTNTLNFDDVKYIKDQVLVQDKQWLHKYDILICAGSGSKEHIGKVAYITNDINFTFGGFMGVLRCNSNTVVPRFLFHVLTSNYFKNHLKRVAESNSSTINNINNGTWKQFKLPIPPLPVQEEIIRILDSFTELTTELTTELAAELAARRKQYGHYRDRLLDFENPERFLLETLWRLCPEGVEYRTIGSLIKRATQKGKHHPGISQVYAVSNTLGVVPSEGVHERQIHSEDTSNYTVIRENMVAYNPSRLNVGSIGILKKRTPGLVSPMYVVCEIDSEKINCQYFEYSVRSSFVRNKIDALKEEGARFRFDFSRWNLIEIPVPPLPVQEEIVRVLDRFDALCNDLTGGLPAEIEGRRRQYEHWRDKLLDLPAARGPAGNRPA